MAQHTFGLVTVCLGWVTLWLQLEVAQGPRIQHEELHSLLIEA